MLNLIKSFLAARHRISLIVLLLMTASCTSLQSIPNSLQTLAGDPNSLLNILNDQPISTVLLIRTRNLYLLTSFSRATLNRYSLFHVGQTAAFYYSLVLMNLK